MADLRDLLPLPLSEWDDARLTWQLMCQIVGKVRLTLHPFMNHWWHVTLYISPRGLTTGAIPFEGGQFECEFDVLDHQLVLKTSSGTIRKVSLAGKDIAGFYSETMSALRELGIHVSIRPEPFKCKSTVPFEEDRVHCSYIPERIERAWNVLTSVDPIFKKFRSRFVGKCSPVHMFWHSFDLACTRFSGRKAPPMPQADRVTQEAYTHEVISVGFWFGDDKVPEPAFYAYVAPLPAGLGQEPLPGKAFWADEKGSMALLRYDDFRASEDPESSLMEFLQRTYDVGAKLANWDPALVRSA